jgi:lysophospholipase L1-like esterase
MHLRVPASALLLAALGVLASEPRAQSSATFIARYVTQYGLNPPPKGGIVFAGSSSIRRWERLAVDFADYDTIQRGIGGSALGQWPEWVDELVVPYDPAAVVLYGGSNGIAPPESASGGSPEQNTPQQEFEQFVEFVETVRALEDPAFAPMVVVYIGITPTPARWFLWPESSQVNALIANYAAAEPSVEFIDTSAAFLSTGMPPAAFLFDPDGQHLSQAGYDLWTAAIRPALLAAVPPTKQYVPNPLHPPPGRRIMVDLGPGDGVEGHPTLSPDANGNHWNNWHAIPGKVQVLAGESLGSLLTTNGVPSGIDLVLSGGWKVAGLTTGGLTNPSAALLKRFAIPRATEDFFYTNDRDDPAGFYLTGLDPSRLYNLRFFGSRNIALNLVTRYKVTGTGATKVAELQTSGPGIGQPGAPNANVRNIAQIRNVRPDMFGQIFVDAEPAVGPAAVMNIFELEVAPVVPLDSWVPAPAPGARVERE